MEQVGHGRAGGGVARVVARVSATMARRAIGSGREIKSRALRCVAVQRQKPSSIGREDLKGNLVSVVIAVLAVLFLREVVAWEGSSDIAAFGAGLGSWWPR